MRAISAFLILSTADPLTLSAKLVQQNCGYSGEAASDCAPKLVELNPAWPSQMRGYTPPGKPILTASLTSMARSLRS
jgi:hypothetical protein